MDYFNTWQRIDSEHKTEVKRLTDLKNSSTLLTNEDKEKYETLIDLMDEDQLVIYLKDKLFIETGEDVEDIFLAIKAYKISVV